MIGKIVKGSAFKGCVLYVMNKDKATLLHSEGVLTESPETVINSFYTQYLMNPDIKRPVGHISLSYSKNDTDKLDDKKMVELAKEYMEAMGITNTQYIIVRHEDREHPHVHIVFNRIDNEGKTISDKNDRFRNEKVCKELKLKHGLYFAEGKEEVKLDRLRDRDKTKYEIYHAIKDVIPKSRNWTDLQKGLRKKGVDLIFKYKGHSNEIQGISFVKDNLTFKGSEIDRNFSYGKIDKQLAENKKAEQKQSFVPYEKEHKSISPKSSVPNIVPEGLFDLSVDHTDRTEQEEIEYNKLKKKKKKKRMRL